MVIEGGMVVPSGQGGLCSAWEGGTKEPSEVLGNVLFLPGRNLHRNMWKFPGLFTISTFLYKIYTLVKNYMDKNTLVKS